MTKYGNRKTMTSDGILHDSRKEAVRWMELNMLLRAGEITDLKRQVEFVLIPDQRNKGKLIERKCSYVADFVYTDKSGDQVVEDTKGVRTKDYIIKRKLMLYTHGIMIKEV